MAHNYCTCGGNKGSCIDCAEEEIDRLTAQLAERDAEIEKLRHQSINWVPVFDANMELQTQNAALRGEVERLKVIKWVQTESYEAVAAVEQARQEAAKEIIQYIEAQGKVYDAYGVQIYHLLDGDILVLKQRYGLEG